MLRTVDRHTLCGVDNMSIRDSSRNTRKTDMRTIVIGIGVGAIMAAGIRCRSKRAAD